MKEFTFIISRMLSAWFLMILAVVSLAFLMSGCEKPVEPSYSVDKIKEISLDPKYGLHPFEVNEALNIAQEKSLNGDPEQCITISQFIGEFLPAYGMEIPDVVPAANTFHNHLEQGNATNVGNITRVNGIPFLGMSDFDRSQFQIVWKINGDSITVGSNPTYSQFNNSECGGVVFYTMEVEHLPTHSKSSRSFYAFQGWRDGRPECDCDGCPSQIEVMSYPLLPESEPYEFMVDPGYDFSGNGKIDSPDMLEVLSKLCLDV